MTLAERKEEEKVQIKGFRVIVIATAIIVTLALLFGIKYVNERFNIEKPLFKMYSETKLVLKPSIDKEGDTTTITLTLKKTDNLYSAYQDIKSDTEKVLGDKKFQIKILDKRSPELEEAYRDSQFVVYEALAKGNYTSIPAEVARYAAAKGAKAKVYIDGENIYVSLYKGDNYLYEIISRRNYQMGGDVADTMGSDNNAQRN